MSRIGQTVFDLQEADDSFDGQGWLGEVTPIKTPKPEVRKAPAKAETRNQDRHRLLTVTLFKQDYLA
ncbi:MAG TPA: hypothetical protein VF598_06005 [Hymenobacter sp.]|jgi:hypothetical protein